jgi:excisionase family DNA binding protein
MPEFGFYTVQEVADRLKITRDGVYGLLKEGKLKGHRFSERRIRISETDLNEFLKDHRTVKSVAL